MSVVVHYCRNARVAARMLASDLSVALRSALAVRRTVTLAVPGGRSAKLVLPFLFDCDLPWHCVEIMPTDERAVPANSTHSNSRLVRSLMRGRRAARARFVGTNQLRDRRPGSRRAFDAVFAGVGEDGHTASLFPGRRTPDGRRRPIASWSPREPVARLSLTIDSLADTHSLFLLVCGESKRRAFANASRSMSALPVARLLHKCRGSVAVYADQDE